jgi:hypothetical protein
MKWVGGEADLEVRVSETSPDESQGVLASPALSLPCDRASCKVSKTFKLTNSGAQDVYASEQSARLSSVDTLAYSLRPVPDTAPKGAKQEKRELVCT